MNIATLTKRQVADLLQLSTRTVDRFDADNSPERSFPRPIRVGTRKRWLASEITAWIQAQSIGHNKIPA